MSEQYKQMSKKDKLPLKYACVQQDIKQHISQVLDGVGNQELRGHINDLYDLIEWQRERTTRQELQIVAVKHLEAFKRYDRPLEDYDPTTRKYKDKPGDAYKE
tara:strand:- start:483 stop:791 length:309 start_codon:yes stop_codon:yes gene_type:complete